MIQVETDVSEEWDSRIDWPALAERSVRAAVAHSRHAKLSESEAEVSVKLTSDEEVRTLNDAFIILDEAQNTTPQQMKMFLTRFGMRARMVICGDPNQTDLPNGVKSGLNDAVGKLEGIKGIDCIRFGVADVVRHPLVGRIVEAYEGPGTQR